MTRDAADAALMMDVISGADWRDWSQLGAGRAARSGRRWPVRSPGCGWPTARRSAGTCRWPRTVAAAVRRAVERLAGLGADVEEIDPGIADPVEAFHTLWFSGAARVVQHWATRTRALLDPGLREICEQGARYSALDYLAAVDTRMALGQAMGRFHSAYDLLVTPTEPITAFEAGVEVPAGSRPHPLDGLDAVHLPVQPHPAARRDLPCGVDGDGLPIGVQLVGARHADALVLRAAHALYKQGPRRSPRPVRRLTPAWKLSDSPSAPARHRSWQASAIRSRPSTTVPHTMPGTQPASPLISRLLRS